MNEKWKMVISRGSFLLTGAVFLFLPVFCYEFRSHAPGVAVITGAIFAIVFGNPFARFTEKLVSPLLGAAIVGMGFGMNFFDVLKAGADGVGYTFIGIAAGILLGVVIGKRLGVTRDTMYLISIGTSVCGGSAIAAAAPVIKAKAHDIAIASATVFTLNAVALLVFPVIGHMFNMTQVQFGYWSALGIHDTSSVVGATYQYGSEALAVGTTVKLARALWIVPVTLILSWLIAPLEPGKSRKLKFKLPWFIPGFIGAAMLVTLIPGTASAGNMLKTFSQYIMILTLFFIGANINRAKLRELGFKPVLQGIILWLILATSWGVAICTKLITLPA
jgi:uncharacterized integral membrane protein (TIGR00698 family)